ncbi:hypothetical protein WN51_13342 [Melipona quadrifasciata]|uniref:Uncharacterized protein n=1 Tax=Melipona quadrifasciata TaxID=166423 RepID=A0A0N0U653_9HYME|nr:hypothetical protein WN51_13342 [Melipona quadrifasciata]
MAALSSKQEINKALDRGLMHGTNFPEHVRSTGQRDDSGRQESGPSCLTLDPRFSEAEGRGTEETNTKKMFQMKVAWYSSRYEVVRYGFDLKGISGMMERSGMITENCFYSPTLSVFALILAYHHRQKFYQTGFLLAAPVTLLAEQTWAAICSHLRVFDNDTEGTRSPNPLRTRSGSSDTP